MAPSPSSTPVENLDSKPSSRTPVVTAPVSKQAAADASPAPSRSAESPMAGMAKMLGTPGMKAMIQAQQKAMLDFNYASLFNALDLSTGDLDAFKQLLLDKQMAIIDASLALMNRSTSTEKRKEAQVEVMNVTSNYEGQIRALLGEEGFAVYKGYEETQTERMQVKMFEDRLFDTDPLSVEQEDRLIRAMYEERTNFSFSAGMSHPESVTPDFFNEATMTNMLAEMSRLDEKSLARASMILSSNQLEQFKQSQEQQRNMREMGMKMAASMFGSDASSATTNRPAP
jgi:hypothetical protein